MSAGRIEDPLEAIVSAALQEANIAFVREDHASNEARLDFYLCDLDVYIEVKQFHSARIASQMARASNVIALQGKEAVIAFCAMLKM